MSNKLVWFTVLIALWAIFFSFRSDAKVFVNINGNSFYTYDSVVYQLQRFCTQYDTVWNCPTVRIEGITCEPAVLNPIPNGFVLNPDNMDVANIAPWYYDLATKTVVIQTVQNIECYQRVMFRDSFEGDAPVQRRERPIIPRIPGRPIP